MPAEVPKLIGSRNSPFVRRLLLLLKAHEGTAFEFKPINFLEVPADAEYLRSISPINKVPILVDRGHTIYESRVIARYLCERFGWEWISIDEENSLSLIDAANDVAVNLFLLRRGGLDLEKPNAYVERQKERVTSILNVLEPWAKERDENRSIDWNYPTMSLLSYIDWGVFRSTVDFSQFPGLIEFSERFRNHKGVAETAPRPTS